MIAVLVFVSRYDCGSEKTTNSSDRSPVLRHRSFRNSPLSLPS